MHGPKIVTVRNLTNKPEQPLHSPVCRKTPHAQHAASCLFSPALEAEAPRIPSQPRIQRMKPCLKQKNKSKQTTTKFTEYSYVAGMPMPERMPDCQQTGGNLTRHGLDYQAWLLSLRVKIKGNTGQLHQCSPLSNLISPSVCSPSGQAPCLPRRDRPPHSTTRPTAGQKHCKLEQCPRCRPIHSRTRSLGLALTQNPDPWT